MIEHVIVVKGRAEVGPETEASIIEEGDCITFLAERSHRFHALGGPARLLSLTGYP